MEAFAASEAQETPPAVERRSWGEDQVQPLHNRKTMEESPGTGSPAEATHGARWGMRKVRVPRGVRLRSPEAPSEPQVSCSFEKSLKRYLAP